MTIQYALLLLLLGSVISIIVFYLFVKFEMSIEKDKDEDKILSKNRWR